MNGKDVQVAIFVCVKCTDWVASELPGTDVFVLVKRLRGDDALADEIVQAIEESLKGTASSSSDTLTSQNEIKVTWRLRNHTH